MKFSFDIKLKLKEQVALDIAANYENESLWESLAEILLDAGKRIGKFFSKK